MPNNKIDKYDHYMESHEEVYDNLLISIIKLQENDDLDINTNMSYIIGYIIHNLEKSGKLNK